MRVANSIISEDMHLVIGCRILDRIIHQLELDEFLEYRIFCGVDSVADEYFVSEGQRARWDPEALERKDKEYDRAVAVYLPEVKDACRQLITHVDSVD